nr:hypothetical protein CFP56_29055 [Quercus suber]
MGKILCGAVTIQHRKGRPFNFAKLEEKPLPLVEYPLPSPPAPGLRPFQEQPPSPGGPSRAKSVIGVHCNFML